MLSSCCFMREWKSWREQLRLKSDLMRQLHVGYNSSFASHPCLSYQNLTVIYCKWLCWQCEQGFNDALMLSYWRFHVNNHSMDLVYGYSRHFGSNDSSFKIVEAGKDTQKLKRFVDKSSFLFTFNCLQESSVDVETAPHASHKPTHE